MQVSGAAAPLVGAGLDRRLRRPSGDRCLPRLARVSGGVSFPRVPSQRLSWCGGVTVGRPKGGPSNRLLSAVLGSSSADRAAGVVDGA